MVPTENAMLDQRYTDGLRLADYDHMAHRANKWGLRRAQQQIRELAARAPIVQDPELSTEESP